MTHTIAFRQREEPRQWEATKYGFPHLGNHWYDLQFEDLDGTEAACRKVLDEWLEEESVTETATGEYESELWAYRVVYLPAWCQPCTIA